MGFGMLSLPDVIGELTDAERNELEEVTHWALVQDAHRPVPGAGLPRAGLRRRRDQGRSTPIGEERAAGAEGSHYRRLFRKDLHGTLLGNLAKIGLLTERMRPRLESVGIRVPANLQAVSD